MYCYRSIRKLGRNGADMLDYVNSSYRYHYLMCVLEVYAGTTGIVDR